MLLPLRGFFSRASVIVGDGNVSRDPSWGAPEGLQGDHSYGDPFPLDKPHIPMGAVRPATVGEVREVVKLANELRVPIWTVSRGKNLGVILDLHRMRRIIEINEEYAYAIVEPGVTFMDLYDEIQKQGLNLWLSVPALGWGSIVGNTLERGIGYTPEGAHYKHQSGMEVVLPNGDLLRTGMGAVKDSKIFPLYSGGFGPGLDGLFFQSNFGVVTKMGIHMSPAPQSYTSIQVDMPDVSDVVPLVGAMTDLMRRRLILNPPQLFDKATLVLSSQDPDVIAALGPYAALDKHIPDELIDRICVDHGFPAWRANFALYGPPEAISGVFAAVKHTFDGIPAAKLTSRTCTAPPGTYLKGSQVPPGFLPQNGVPSIEALKALTSTKDGLWHNCFSPVVPPSGRELYDWYLSARAITTAHDLNFVADFHVFDRYFIAINLVFFHPLAHGRLRGLQVDLMKDCHKRGLLEYRAHISFMDMTAANQDFNNRSFSRFTTLLKDSIDPNGVLSPGKSGIWNSGAGSETARSWL
ncbi:FAD linked oxidase domain [Fusarium albosuccineum]|uniref:FAD linked oxidase domain n=1 Tax=Fusarium albosuccineum TaxID=1237068 RepID=A0A8H4KAS9_9HYPO|nr:FAD linked oxidase domain [Fusarium albosuccineum]